MASEPFKIELEFPVLNQRFLRAEQGIRRLASSLSFDAGSQRQRINRALAQVLKSFLDVVVEAMRQRHSTRWSPGSRLPAGDRQGRLHSRSGSLLQGFTVNIRSGKTFPEGELIARHPGIRTHEHGATIRARRARYLTIPLPSALDSRGVPLKRSAREWRNTFVRRSSGGNLVIFQSRGGQLVPLYVLKTEVKIPARLGLQTTLLAAVNPTVDRMGEAMLEAISENIRRELRG